MSGVILQDSETGRSATQKATGGAAWVTSATLLAGELQQYNRLAGGAICKYKIVTDDATGLNIASGPAILYGVVLVAAGTMAGVYDALTVTGTALIASTTATVTFGGVGIICPTGITADWTSGTWLVLYAN